MDLQKAFHSAAGVTQRIFSEAIRVLYAYPIFLIALGAMFLYATIQCLSSCK
jgi:hypothetical protein